MRLKDREEKEVATHKISEIIYSLWSPDDIRKISVAEINRPELYDADGYPVSGGLVDLRLGVTEPGLRCKTCGGKVDTCLGHWGHLELAKPVYHVGFLRYLTEVFKAVCHKCGRVTLTPEEKERFMKEAIKVKEKYGERAFWKVMERAFKEAKKKKTCPYCNAKKPKVESKRQFFFIFVDGESLLPDRAREILEKIPNEDLWFIGMNPKYNRPEWMILTVLPIPPVTIRPSITLETGLKTEDDLTHKLADIVRVNQALKEYIESGSPMTTILDHWQLLQYHVATYIDNRPNSKWGVARHRSGKALKTLTQRIAGKEGRIRQNLAGKRVNFSARATIIPDAWIMPNEVGVPIEVAKELTYPEHVTEFNIERLKEYIKNGPDKYVGANYVIDENGVRRKIMESNKEKLLEDLKPGWVVERHMIEGDYVLLHRYPSLHRMNTMAHRVRILPGKVFRINPAATTPYNADFDGDEMDINRPQIETSIAELKYLMDVKHHLVTPRYGLPIVGAKQDFIMGAFMLTRYNVYYTREEVLYLLGYAGIFVDSLPKPAKIVEGTPYWSGKQVYSLILPKISYEGKTFLGKELENDPDARLVIKEGEIKEGVIDVVAIGTEKGKLLRKIIEVYGKDEALKFLHRSNLLALAVLEKEGLTIDLDDMSLPEKAIQEKEKIIREALEKVKELIDKYERGELEPLPGKNPRRYSNNKNRRSFKQGQRRASRHSG